MTYIKGEKSLKLRLIPLIIALLFVPAVIAQAAPSPKSLSFEIFTDGVVRTEYGLTVDQTAAQVNITLFGELIQDLFIYDEEGLPLESTRMDDYYLVNTLGASTINVSYLTNALTGKTGAIWSIDVETPISTEITLPLSSTIINLNEIPLEIETIDEQTRLVMPAGRTIVSYTIYIQDSESLAEDAINIAQTVIDDGKDDGVILTQAEEILAEAISAFDSEGYLTAQEKASEAEETAEEIRTLEGQTVSELNQLREKIQEAEDAGRTVGLDEVIVLLEEAEEHHSNGEYMLAFEKTQIAMGAVFLTYAPESRDNTLLLASVVIVILGAGVFMFQRRKKPALPPADDEIDLKLLFEEHPELRMDDKVALRFMAEHGGEAFAHEVRERLGIPRTSAWRMVQRLQRFEVVDEKKIGGQSLVFIVERYRRKKT